VKRIATSVLFVVIACCSVVAKDQPFQVISWPGADKPVVRFTFSKFKELGIATGKAHTYITEVTADNLSEKTISGVNLSLYVFDKSKARIGEGYINLTNVAAGETVKFPVTISASGVPNSLSVEASAPRTVSITVNSVPQGAALTVDGKTVGTTPKIIDIAGVY
jgi:PEGA domain